MTKTIRCVATASVFALAAAGCAATPAEEAEKQASAEEIGETSQALTNVNNCAMGTTANAVANLLADGSQESYSRASGYIDGICPALGQDRPVTIVNFEVASVNGWEYQFWVRPTWWEATNPAQCAAFELNVRFQKMPLNSTTEWEQIDFQSIHGTWVWDFSEPNLGHCNTPRFDAYRINSQSFQQRETNRYRIRTEAFQFDHDFHATVEVFGRNRGF